MLKADWKPAIPVALLTLPQPKSANVDIRADDVDAQLRAPDVADSVQLLDVALQTSKDCQELWIRAGTTSSLSHNLPNWEFCLLVFNFLRRQNWEVWSQFSKNIFKFSRQASDITIHLLVQNYLFKPPKAQGVMSTLLTVTTQSQMGILAATALCNEELFSKSEWVRWWSL